MPEFSVIVIGGGAAGFFAAINCAQLHPECSVTILEKTSQLLAKVKVSGGGRCNVTNACTDNSLLVKNYPRGEKELRSVFSRFSTTDTFKWFEERGVKLKAESDGRIFPVTNSSETIVNCLMNEAERSGVKIKLGVSIEKIISNPDNTFTLSEKGGGIFHCDKLIVASGGNANESSYEWLKKLGHTIIKPVPSLFTFNMPGNPVTKLMGVSASDADVKIAGTKIHTRGAVLVTHWGMSGPAILKASAFGARILSELNYNFSALINWLPETPEEELKNILSAHKKENAGKIISTDSPFEIPKRLWEFFVTKAGIKSTLRWADLPKKENEALCKIILSDEYPVRGKTTFKEEFVTCGGVSLKEIDFGTMQSKIVPNLFFAGEIIDVDGITGGFNFQNAWSTAWVAAKNITSSSAHSSPQTL